MPTETSKCRGRAEVQSVSGSRRGWYTSSKWNRGAANLLLLMMEQPCSTQAHQLTIHMNLQCALVRCYGMIPCERYSHTHVLRTTRATAIFCTTRLTKRHSRDYWETETETGDVEDKPPCPQLLPRGGAGGVSSSVVVTRTVVYIHPALATEKYIIAFSIMPFFRLQHGYMVEYLVLLNKIVITLHWGVREHPLPGSRRKEQERRQKGRHAPGKSHPTPLGVRKSAGSPAHRIKSNTIHYILKSNQTRIQQEQQTHSLG